MTLKMEYANSIFMGVTRMTGLSAATIMIMCMVLQEMIILKGGLPLLVQALTTPIQCLAV